MRTKEQIDGILAALEREYPMADCTLTERDAWRLLVQVRLAAQCTDARVNLVTPASSRASRTVEAMRRRTSARSKSSSVPLLLPRQGARSRLAGAAHHGGLRRQGARTIWTIS